MIDRMMRAARLDTDLYEEVEHDTGLTTQALQVVVLVSICTGIGAAIGGRGNPILALILGVLSALLGWAVWSYATYLVGTRIFGGTATYGELLRTIGFAQSPGVLRIISFIPILGGLIALATAIWSIIAGVIAVRQALDFDTGKAIATIVVAFIPAVIVIAILSLPLAAISR